MPRAFAEIAFTPNVRAEQARHGSAHGYARFLAPDIVDGHLLGPQEADFIADRDGFYQASVSETGWPYVQFRGGPTGFVHVIDPQTIAYADYRGNRQYISKGNLVGDDRISIIMMDYPNRRRLKLWGRAQFTDGEAAADQLKSLHDPQYVGHPERVVIIKIAAFDWNCPAHIPQRLTEAELAPYLDGLRDRITHLAAENERLSKAANRDT